MGRVENISYAWAGYKAKEVGIEACQSLPTIQNVQGASVDVDLEVDDDHRCHEDYVDIHKDFESNSLKSFIGTVNPTIQSNQEKKQLWKFLLRINVSEYENALDIPERF